MNRVASSTGHTAAESAISQPWFQISCSRDIEAFGDLWPTMSALANRHQGVRAYAFQSRETLDIWLKTFGPVCHTQPIFVKISDGSGNPLMLIPLGIGRRQGVRILSFLDGGVADYNAPVLFAGAESLDAHAMAEIWRGLCRTLPPFDVCMLEKIPEYVDDVANPFCSLAQKQWYCSGHLITLSGTADEFSRSRNPHAKTSLRNIRRLSEIGKVRFTIAKDKETAGKLFDALVRMKSRRYLETRGVDNFNLPGCKAYFTAMTQELLPNGHVNLSALLVGDEIIAADWGLVVGGRYYGLMSAWEAGAWAKYSPGRLMIEHLIAWAFGEHLQIFDLGAGDEPYKLGIQDTVLKLSGGGLARTALGRCYLILRHFRASLGVTPLGSALKSLRTRIRVKVARMHINKGK